MANAPLIARRWFDEVWNARREEMIDELMADESVGHVETGDVVGRNEFKKMRAMFLAAVPDLRIDVEDVVAEGERAAVRWRVTGTHTGDGFGFPGTGKAVAARGTTWLVQDTCTSTLTRVTEGVVTVRDNVKKKNVVVRAGKRYTAKPKR